MGLLCHGLHPGHVRQVVWPIPHESKDTGITAMCRVYDIQPEISGLCEQGIPKFRGCVSKDSPNFRAV